MVTGGAFSVEVEDFNFAAAPQGAWGAIDVVPDGTELYCGDAVVHGVPCAVFSRRSDPEGVYVAQPLSAVSREPELRVEVCACWGFSARYIGRDRALAATVFEAACAARTDRTENVYLVVDGDVVRKQEGELGSPWRRRESDSVDAAQAAR